MSLAHFILCSERSNFALSSFATAVSSGGRELDSFGIREHTVLFCWCPPTVPRRNYEAVLLTM